MARHDFLEPTVGDVCVLVIDETAAGEHGIEHEGCTELALAVPHLDAWQCSACGRRGRISGAWATEWWLAEATSGGA